jgi:hypothetical protein
MSCEGAIASEHYLDITTKAEVGQNQTILPLGIRLALPAPTR